jgi:hypothetical protein
MSASSASQLLRVLLALPPLARGLEGALRRWRWLTTSLFDPYRPERHYMRGPGPKWREKHARAAQHLERRVPVEELGAGVRWTFRA